MENIHGFIKYYFNREIEWVDKVEKKASIYYFNIYDLHFLQNEVISPLIKEGIPYEWIMKTDIKEVFLRLLHLHKKVLVENARYWFREKLQEIERKAKEQIKTKNAKGETIMEDPDPELIEKRKKQLYPKYFRKEKPKNEENF